MNENLIPALDSGRSRGTPEGGNPFKISSSRWFLGLLTAFLVLIGVTSRGFGTVTASYVDLGAANNFTVLATGTSSGGGLVLNRLDDTGGKTFTTNPAITGNIGIGTGVALYPNGNSAFTLSGTWVYSDASQTKPSYVTANGGSVQNAALVTQAAHDIKTFSNTAANFTTTQTALSLSAPPSSITDTGYVTAGGFKISVITFTGTGLLSLSNFTINGAANDIYYINFLNNQSLQLSGSITLAGGVLAQNVYWNFNNSADIWKLQAGASLSGRIVAPFSTGTSGNASGSQVIGGIYGEDIDIRGGTVLGVPTTQVVPEAGSLTAGGIFCGLLLGSGWLSKVRRKKRKSIIKP